MDAKIALDDLPHREAVLSWLSWLDSAEYPVPASPHLSIEEIHSLAHGRSEPLDESSLRHLAACARCVSTLRAVASHQPHLSVEDLWAIVADDDASLESPFAREHLASCSRCSRALAALRSDVEENAPNDDIWDPEEFHAASPGEIPPVLSEDSRDKRYHFTFQRRDDEFDVLTVRVAARHRAALEGKKITVIAADGTVVLSGTISGGTIVRGDVPIAVRQKRPFFVQTET